MKYLLLILLAFPALAMERAQGPCAQGGKTIVGAPAVGQAPVTRGFVQSYKNCTVTVYFSGTTTKPTIYSTNTSTPLANPFTADQFGVWYFYALDGRYDVQISGGGPPALAAPYTFGDIQLFDQSSLWANVVSFGAVPDGTTDSTAAFALAAASVAGGGTVYVPNGNFVVSGISLPASVGLQCESSQAARIYYSGSGTLLRTAANALDQQMPVHNCYLIKQSSQGGTAISLTGVWRSEIAFNQIQNFSTGIDLNGTTYGSYFDRVTMNVIVGTTIGVRLTGGSGQSANSNTITDNRITGASTGIQGISGSVTQGNLITRNDIESFAAGTSYGIDWEGDNSTLSANWVETTCAATCAGIKLRGAGNFLLDNKYSLAGTGDTQLDYDASLPNVLEEISTGSTPVYAHIDTTGSIADVWRSTGPVSRWWWNTANSANNRIWAFALGSANLFCVNQIADSLAVNAAPTCWDINGAIIQTHSITTGGAGVDARDFAQSQDGTKQVEMGCTNSTGCFAGTTTADDYILRRNSTELMRLTTNGPKFAIGTTGATATTFGSNCPAITCTAPYTWIKAEAPDGSVIYIPGFK